VLYRYRDGTRLPFPSQSWLKLSKTCFYHLFHRYLLKFREFAPYLPEFLDDIIHRREEYHLAFYSIRN
jgi:hypothetical protein